MESMQIELKDGILICRLNRPEKHNCLNHEIFEGLEIAINEASLNPEIHAMLLVGHGPSFCAGADIKRLAECNGQSGFDFAKSGQAVMNQIESMDKPCIAALHGHVLGGGCELAMSAHLRFAHENTLLGQPEVKLGVIPGYGGTQRLSRLIGRSRAMDLCLTGRFIDAQTALNWGLVDQVISGDVEQAAFDYLQKLKDLPYIAKASIIQSIMQGIEMPLSQALELEALHFAKCCASHDKQEGVEAFLQKRPAQFKGC